jgi:hypothetical protein
LPTHRALTSKCSDKEHRRSTAGRLLGLVKFPKSAEYLVQHYEQLEGRIFKQKNIREFNRRWYEYIWPREPKVMLAAPKIITPRLTRQVRFAMDTVGVVPQDSCICLVPTKKTHQSWHKLREQLETSLGKNLSDGDALKYCLAFLNSPYAQERLVTGRLPTPKGSYAVTEDYLHEIPMPPPPTRQTAIEILDLVDKLMLERDERRTAQLELELSGRVNNILGVH